MATLRQKWKVAWDDDPPITVTSTVQDLINAVDDLPLKSGRNKVAVSTALIYTALVRTGVCTLSYEAWLNVLDMYEEVNPKANGSGPTDPAASPPEPSLSDALPVRTGGPGSNGTPEP